MSKERPSSKASAPIKPVGERPMLRLPATLPKDYPDILRTHTEALLTATVGVGYTRRELILCCKELLDELDPKVYAAVHEGLTPHAAQEAVRGLIRQIIDENRATEDEREEAARQVRESWPWGKLIQGIEEASQRRADEVQKTIAQLLTPPVVAKSKPVAAQPVIETSGRGKESLRSTSPFNSPFDLAVCAIFQKHPKATAEEECGYLDADHMVELPSRMKTKIAADKRSFKSAYRYSPAQRHALGSAVSKVRVKLRKLKNPRS